MTPPVTRSWDFKAIYAGTVAALGWAGEQFNNKTVVDIANQAKRQAQQHAARVASRVTKRGRFLPGIDGLNEATEIYNNNFDPKLTVRVKTSKLQIFRKSPWQTDRFIHGSALAGVKDDGWEIYGTITLVKEASGSIKVKPDTYDFDMHTDDLIAKGDLKVPDSLATASEWIPPVARDTATIVGKSYAGYALGNTPFIIAFDGEFYDRDD
jgi:hypothetical protein